jgi:hypothetical protein
MSLQFHQAVENMDVWSASSADISFVITFASPTGTGFHGRRGFLASWRPLYSSTGAVKVIGSPFKTFADAQAACDTMLGELARTGRTAVCELDVGVTLVPPEPAAERDGGLDTGAELLTTTASR